MTLLKKRSFLARSYFKKEIDKFGDFYNKFSNFYSPVNRDQGYDIVQFLLSVYRNPEVPFPLRRKALFLYFYNDIIRAIYIHALDIPNFHEIYKRLLLEPTK